MPLMRNAIGVLLAGGQGERLWPLTRDRGSPLFLSAAFIESSTLLFPIVSIAISAEFSFSRNTRRSASIVTSAAAGLR